MAIALLTILFCFLAMAVYAAAAFAGALLTAFVIDLALSVKEKIRRASRS